MKKTTSTSSPIKYDLLQMGISGVTFRRSREEAMKLGGGEHDEVWLTVQRVRVWVGYVPALLTAVLCSLLHRLLSGLCLRWLQ